MGDPYWRYGAVPPDRASAQITSFPGHLSSEASTLTTGQPWKSNGFPGSSSDFPPRDIFPYGPGSYGGDGLLNTPSRSGVDGLGTSAGIQRYPSQIEDIRSGSGIDGLGTSAGIQRYPSQIQDIRSGSGVDGLGTSASIQRYPSQIQDIRSGSGVDGLVTSAGIQRYPSPIQDRNLLSQRHDAAPRISDSIPQMHGSVTRTDGPLATAAESNVLFVDGLPTDCSRREVGHLFRPFIGFKEIKVVHKEARRKGDKAMVLCFVEFADAKCALTAMEALQGYKFDDKKPESPVLQICYAHFPFRLPSHNEHQQLGPSQ
ncbi:hypothetical protein Leryth_007406 [Lithospermum erythrorhizon]|nr:hypothetical protein Leryth_007406 [Lithospermum erythrorhizon]